MYLRSGNLEKMSKIVQNCRKNFRKIIPKCCLQAIMVIHLADLPFLYNQCLLMME